jgi:hypothetical protein
MQFNFPLFRGLATRAYQNVGNNAFSLKEVLSVFEYYFDAYEKHMGRLHPNIRMQQIERIISVMPYIDGDGSSSAGDDIDVGSYEVMIDKHFQTEYNVGYGGCDYNINHLFSGDIRLMRFYDTCY